MIFCVVGKNWLQPVHGDRADGSWPKLDEPGYFVFDLEYIFSIVLLSISKIKIKHVQIIARRLNFEYKKYAMSFCGSRWENGTCVWKWIFSQKLRNNNQQWRKQRIEFSKQMKKRKPYNSNLQLHTNLNAFFSILTHLDTLLTFFFYGIFFLALTKVIFGQQQHAANEISRWNAFRATNFSVIKLAMKSIEQCKRLQMSMSN